jgi:bifunctional non-homologous end joining protein LigD
VKIKNREHPAMSRVMVKYDGYRLRLERDGDRVRLITRGGENTLRIGTSCKAARFRACKLIVSDASLSVAGKAHP